MTLEKNMLELTDVVKYNIAANGIIVKIVAPTTPY